ncbi:hypothetical protein H2200_011649 [Cladophialophora chaetospira]|uniref:Uncharacterized protein n=1 Tax=Cladophialophora chaetospira TaxID=386627 RepID=A0AA38WZP8_9EURO|nr:hypothetical protein H2200_011649 [Cladophialophora chaetospira]
MNDGLYSMWTKDRKTELRFSFPEVAPSQAALAINYARFTHNETGANEYALALTTEATADPSTGGNFYVAQYGILCEAEPNTVTIWRVRDKHGTSLYERIPRMNTGVAFFVPDSLVPNAENPVAPPFSREYLVTVPRPPLPRAPIPTKKTAENTNQWCLRWEEEDVGEGVGKDGSTIEERQILVGAGFEAGGAFD